MIKPDVPITTAKNDKLNRKKFADDLARVLLQASFPNSFTVGLYGKWGSGKTSLLNMVFESIREMDENTVIFQFNPWLCPDARQLIIQFFKQMAGAIKKTKRPDAEVVCGLIDDYADVLDLATMVPVAGAAIASMLKMTARRIKKSLENKYSDLQKKKDKIIAEIKEKSLKLIISIDDVDRLSEDEIIAVFQLVKSLADFTNTAYIIAFDYDVVVRALGKVQHGDGREYLEKVIQAPFEIPVADSSIVYGELFSRLDEIMEDMPEVRWDKATWAELLELGIKKYVKSLRDVIRYTNVYYLKYELLKEETNPVDLLGLTCLQVFEPMVYSRVSLYKDSICGSGNAISYECQQEESEKRDKTIEELLESKTTINPEAAKNILVILFPRLNTSNGFMFWAGRYYDHKKFVLNNNISVADSFNRYFSLTLENDAISRVEVERFIYDIDESTVTDEINRYYAEGKIIRLLEAISTYFEQDNPDNIPKERADILLRCICRAWDSFNVPEKGFFDYPFRWRLFRCAEPLLRCMDEDGRISYLHGIFADKMVQLTTLALLLSHLETQHGRLDDKEEKADSPLVSLEGLLVLEDLFKSRVRLAIENGSAFEKYGGLDFLTLLGKIDEEFFKEIRESIIINDPRLVNIVSYCTYKIKTAGRIVTRGYHVDFDALYGFIDPQEAYSRLTLYVSSQGFRDFSEDFQMDVMAFLIIMESKDESRSPLDDCVSEGETRRRLQEQLNKK